MKSDGFLEPNMGESVLSCYGKIILWWDGDHFPIVMLFGATPVLEYA